MEQDHKEKNYAQWLSVPQFGDWDQKGSVPDYSMDFTKIREMRKLHKRDPSRASLGNEEELFASKKEMFNAAQNEKNHQYQHDVQHQSPTVKRSIFSCFRCYRKA